MLVTIAAIYIYDVSVLADVTVTGCVYVFCESTTVRIELGVVNVHTGQFKKVYVLPEMLNGAQPPRVTVNLVGFSV